MGVSSPRDSPSASNRASVPAAQGQAFRIDEDLLALIRSLLDSRHGSQQTTETPSAATEGPPQGLPLPTTSSPAWRKTDHHRGKEKVSSRLHSSTLPDDTGHQPSYWAVQQGEGRDGVSQEPKTRLPAPGKEVDKQVQVHQRKQKTVSVVFPRIGKKSTSAISQYTAGVGAKDNRTAGVGTSRHEKVTKRSSLLSPSPGISQRLESEPSWTTCSGSRSDISDERPGVNDAKTMTSIDHDGYIGLLDFEQRGMDPGSLFGSQQSSSSFSEQSAFSVAVPFNAVAWPDTPVSGPTEYTTSPKGSIVPRLKLTYPSLPAPSPSILQAASPVPPVFTAGFEYGKPAGVQTTEAYELHTLKRKKGQESVRGAVDSREDLHGLQNEPPQKQVYKPYRPRKNVQFQEDSRDPATEKFVLSGVEASNDPLAVDSTRNVSGLKARSAFKETRDPPFMVPTPSGPKPNVVQAQDTRRNPPTRRFGDGWLRPLLQRAATFKRTTRDARAPLTTRPIRSQAAPGRSQRPGFEGSEDGYQEQPEGNANQQSPTAPFSAAVNGLETVLKEALLIANQAADNNDVAGLEAIMREAALVSDVTNRNDNPPEIDADPDFGPPSWAVARSPSPETGGIPGQHLNPENNGVVSHGFGSNSAVGRYEPTLPRTGLGQHNQWRVSYGMPRHLSLEDRYLEKPLALDWSVTRKRFGAGISSLNTAFIGLIVGIYVRLFVHTCSTSLTLSPGWRDSCNRVAARRSRGPCIPGKRLVSYDVSRC